MPDHEELVFLMNCDVYVQVFSHLIFCTVLARYFLANLGEIQ
jgi:hypothetical protein